MPPHTNQFIFNQEFVVTSADVDFGGEITISSLSNLFIQSASAHAEALNWSTDELSSLNLAWVLSSIRIKIFKYPNWQQNVRCETWPKGIDRLFYLRDFILYDSDNNILAVATSNWLLIDIKSRRPKLHNITDKAIDANSDRHAIYEKKQRINTPEEPFFCMNYEVKYTDIDINLHLTTTRYINMMFDTYILEHNNPIRPKEIFVSFIKEVKFGDNVKMQRFNSDNTHLFILCSEDETKTLFKGELIF